MRLTFGITLLLGLLAAVGPVSTDIYLPAFSRIDHDFGAVGAAQITLASWFVGLAVGQMVQGTLTDRFGRRSPLLIGTLVYTLASFGCALAPGTASFSAFRVIAAFCGSASMVIPRALIRDVAEGMAAARLLARLTLVVGVVPILAPAVGGAMLAFMSWRDLFWGAGAYGLLCTALVWRFLPDTLPPERRLRHNAGQMLANFIQIAREPVFTTNVLAASCAFAGLFAYIGGSASVYTGHFHLSPTQYGLLFGGNAMGFIVCANLAPRAAGRWGIDRVIRVGIRVLAASFAVAAVAAFTTNSLVALAVPVFVGQAVCGLLGPLTTVNALSRHRAHAGSASALMGTWQFGLVAVAGVLVGLTANGTARPMSVLMVLFAVGAVVADRFRPAEALKL